MKYRDKIAKVLDGLGIPRDALGRVLPVSIDMYHDTMFGRPRLSAYAPRLARAIDGRPSTRLYRELMSLFERHLAECTCSGAFAGFTPDHAVTVAPIGLPGELNSGGKARKSVAGYSYADPADYRLKEADHGVVTLPYGVKFDYLTFTCYEDGVPDTDMGQDSRLVRDAKDYLKEKYGEYLSSVDVRVFADPGPDEFRVFFRTVKPVYRHGYNVHYAGAVRYEVYAQGSLVFDDAQEARDCGWNV